MSAAYDTYDYPSYWKGREYEHRAEVIAIKSFLERIPKVGTILEVGAGFGRLVSSYAHRAKKIVLEDPSSKLLKLAKSRLPNSNIKTLHLSLENLPRRLKKETIDLAIIVRVLHHVQSIDKTFSIISRILKKNGYLILEFANKRHLKATFLELFKGNLTYLFDILPRDRRSLSLKKKKTLPFINYHPDLIKDKLKSYGFKIIDKRSVSNVRSSFIKNNFPSDILLGVEKVLQRPLAHINFGPSIFILAKKKG